MKLLKISIFFLVLNFSALAIGSWLMNNGPMTNWYVNLNQAPWTPPGWVFGIAWTTIMICFSVYMAYLFIEISNSSLILLYL
ncbi:tryptophan-rich sensory protein, partial [Flavobacteriaceae bacterium]|nr:tryptophan-rich sensory protein [Flavobacteriaceae bacterium]